MIPDAKYTALGPWATSIAPTIPPISACEELEGSPKYHVDEVPRDGADEAG